MEVGPSGFLGAHWQRQGSGRHACRLPRQNLKARRPVSPPPLASLPSGTASEGAPTFRKPYIQEKKKSRQLEPFLE